MISSSPRADGFRKRRGDPHEVAKHAPCLAEAQSGVEVLDEGEDVTLAFAERIPPAAAAVIDDHDLARTAAVFEAAARALGTVEPPPGRQPLQQRGAAHAGLQPFNLRVLFAHLSVLLSGRGGRDAP